MRKELSVAIARGYRYSSALYTSELDSQAAAGRPGRQRQRDGLPYYTYTGAQ